MMTFTFLCNLLPIGNWVMKTWVMRNPYYYLPHAHQDHPPKRKCGTKFSSGRRKRVKSSFPRTKSFVYIKDATEEYMKFFKFLFHTCSAEGIFSAVLTSKATGFAGSIFVTLW